MSGRPPPPGEGETPLVNRSTPAGGINTVTAALNSTHNNNNNSSIAMTSTVLSAVNTSSSTAPVSSIKPRSLVNSLNEENQPPSTQNDNSEKKRSRRQNNSNRNEQQSNTPTKSSNATKQSNKSPNPTETKKTKVNNGKNNNRKKKTSRNRTIHQLRPTAPATSANSNNSAPSPPAIAGAPAAASSAESTSNTTVAAPSAEPVTLAAALATKTNSKDKKLDISSARLIEELRPHIFGNNNNVSLAKEDMLEFQNKFDAAKSYNFESRQLSAAARKLRDEHNMQFNIGGFDQGVIRVTARKGDTSHLRRYFVEDILQCGLNHPFVVCLRKPPRLPTNFYSSSPIGIAFSQQKKSATGLGGIIKKFQTEAEYFILTGRMVRNPFQGLVQNGTFMLSNLPTFFHAQHGSILLRLDGTNTVLTFKWFDLINDPLETLFFGSPIVINRFFNQHFNADRTSIQYCYRIYHQLALEGWGDSLHANRLSDAFRSAQISILESQAAQLTKSLADPCKDVSFVGKEYTAFFVKIDKLFQKNLYDTLRQFNDPTASVLSKDEIKQLIEEAKTLFPTLWSLLKSTRGVHPTIKRSAQL